MVGKEGLVLTCVLIWHLTMSACQSNIFIVFLVVFPCVLWVSSGTSFGEAELAVYRKRVVDMFHHAYDGYINHAYPYDELRPITCDGHDTWGSFSLTLIDALDTLAVMGNYTEFQRVAELLDDEVNFDIDINASVFETNIRVIGGLLSAHLFSKRTGLTLEPGWPCSGPLLRLAENVARKLLPAFNTTTGMPYGTVNLKYGVPKGETTITCTAGVGTYIIEFGALSRLTGDPIFEETAMRALRGLWKTRSSIGLVGNHIDVMTGKWTATEAGIGGGVDSYFEYLVKGAVMLENTELLKMYREYEEVLETYVKRDDWYMWANMKKGGITLPVFQSLDAFWPGMQSLLGDIEKGMKTIHNFHQVWRQFGFTPEIYNIPKSEAHQGREGYPLRPELVESAMYLYRATGDPYLLQIGVDVLEAIEYSTKTKCGYATVKDVTSHSLDNRMESFFLAETTKYLYLLFTPDNFIHNTGNHGDVVQTPNGECILDTGGYVFNTEAHPIDMAALYCCSAQKKEDDQILQDLHENLDLLTLLDIVDPETDVFAGRKLSKRRKKVEFQKSKNRTVNQNVKSKEESTTEKSKTEESKNENCGTSTSNAENTDSRQHYITIQDGMTVNPDRSVENDEIAENEKYSASNKNNKNYGFENLKSTIQRNTNHLMKEISSKLNLDFGQLSALVESLSAATTSDIKETTSENLKKTEQLSHRDVENAKKNNDGKEDKKDGENTGENDDKRVNVDAEGQQNAQPGSATIKAEKKSTKQNQGGTSQVQELVQLLKNVLSSSSKDTFSGNSGFSFGNKKEVEVIEEPQTIFDESDELFGHNQPEMLVCPAQPYHMKLSVMGEMFDE